MNFWTHNRMIRAGTAAAAVCFLLLPAGPLHSSPGVLTNLMDASRAIVEIRTETGGALRGPAASFIDPSTGIILTRQPVKGVYYTKSGAGVIIEPQGVIVTNAHIVDGAGRITVTLHDDSVYEADVLTLEESRDLAFLRIRPKTPLEALELADSNSLSLHRKVYSIGNSTYLKSTISEGKVSGLGQDKRYQRRVGPVELIQVDFQVYKGDSGSPLLDEEGKLLGITMAGQTEGNFDTYVIPSNVILKSLLSYIEEIKKDK